jgi:alkaline phosphatase
MHKFLLLVLAIFLASCNHHQPSAALVRAWDPPSVASTDQPAKNVILLIGDGMGLTQISAALYSNDNFLHLEKFPIIGIQKPYASDNLISDSAASGTAIACGVKTYNGAIGVGPEGAPVKNILEEAVKNGMATGIITTSTIVHATPAVFLSHQVSRKMYEEIAVDVVNSGADLLIGGGKKYFDKRSDSKNLYQELNKKNYHVYDFYQGSFESLKIPPGKKLIYLTANGDPVPFSQGRDYLVPASQMAPEFLQNRSSKGFFLMIEGAQIDWGGHANNADYVIQELLEFDQVVGEILKFAQEDGETLVIVTGDHETGGMTINLGSQMNKLVTNFTTEGHSGTLIPVFAYGPGAELFSGIYENTALHKKMRQVLLFEDANADANIQR